VHKVPLSCVVGANFYGTTPILNPLKPSDDVRVHGLAVCRFATPGGVWAMLTAPKTKTAISRQRAIKAMPHVWPSTRSEMRQMGFFVIYGHRIHINKEVFP
jgi:hypothetical protein